MEIANEPKLDIEKEIEIGSILFFDLDGTLVDTNFSNYLSYKRAIQSVVSTDTNIHYNRTERFNRGVLKRILPNLAEIKYEKIIRLKEEYYKEYLPQTELNKSVAEILIRYSKTNNTVLVTNCREDRALLTLNYHGLTDHFTNLFFRQFDGNNRKINKFHNAILCLGISPKLVIAFENEESEITDAMEAGIQYINLIITFGLKSIKTLISPNVRVHIKKSQKLNLSCGN